MDKYPKTLTTIIIAILGGLTTLIALIIIFFLIIGPILDSIFPPEPRSEGLGVISLGEGFERAVIMILVYYVLSNCIAGCISGFLIKRGEKVAGSYIWWSLIVGFTISTFGPAIFYGLLTNAPFAARDLIFVSIPSLVGTLGGATGYYVAGRRYRRRISE